MNRFPWPWRCFTLPSSFTRVYWLLNDVVWFHRSLALSEEGGMLGTPFPTSSTSTQQTQQYAPVVNNPHFIHLTTLLRVPFLSYSWRHNHPQVEFWILERRFREAVQLLPGGTQQEVVNRFVDLLLTVTIADTTLHYSMADMDWFIETLDRPDAKTVLSLFCACYSAPTGRKGHTHEADC